MRRPPTVPASRRAGSINTVLVVAVLMMPIVLGMVGGGAVAKLAYPVLAFLVALWLARVSPPRYVVFLLLVMMLSSGFRYFVEWHTGYSNSDPILLSAFLVVLAALPTVLLHLFNRRAYTVVFTAMLLAIIFGLGVPLLYGSLQAGLLNLVFWGCPPLVAIYLLAHAEQHAAIRAAVRRTLLIALPLMSAYAIWQFVSITPWDAVFLKQVGEASGFGYPVPFQVRVFGTMNAPGTLATFLATGILLTMPSVRGVAWLGLIMSLLAMLLTTQRAAVVSLAVSTLLLLIIGRGRTMRVTLIRLLVTAGLVVSVALAVPGFAPKVAGSLGSFSSLDSDNSGRIRVQQFHFAPQWLAVDPLGQGLGWRDNPAYQLRDNGVFIDSGILDVFVSLGLPGGLLFFAMLGALVVSAARIMLASPDPDAQAEFAAVMCVVVYIPFGIWYAGVTGILLYLFLGLLLAREIVPRRYEGSLPPVAQEARPVLRASVANFRVTADSHQ